MSDEMWAGLQALRTKRMERAQARRIQAAEDFGEAQQLAAAHGLFLVERSGAHYQLSTEPLGWLLNIYPGNCRIYADPNRAKAPWLKLAYGEWTLRAIVEAAVNAVELEEAK